MMSKNALDGAATKILAQKDVIDEQAKCIAELQEFVRVQSAQFVEGNKKTADRIAELEGAAKADEARLIAAAKKAGIAYFGCDTPYHLAELVAELRSDILRVRRERAIALDVKSKEGPKLTEPPVE